MLNFLTLDEALALHADQNRRYGGEGGLLHLNLLGSAFATPRATFDGTYLHPTIFEMAAAYLFHTCQNHPFIDGNKRTSLAASLAFRWMNDYEVVADFDELTELVTGVARGEVTKADIAVFLHENSLPVQEAS
jgi:death-on-curing protein